jgi:hypothetical protein
VRGVALIRTRPDPWTRLMNRNERRGLNSRIHRLGVEFLICLPYEKKVAFMPVFPS